MKVSMRVMSLQSNAHDPSSFLESSCLPSAVYAHTFLCLSFSFSNFLSIAQLSHYGGRGIQSLSHAFSLSLSLSLTLFLSLSQVSAVEMAVMELTLNPN